MRLLNSSRHGTSFFPETFTRSMRLGQEFRVRKSCFFVPTANHVSTYVYYICVYVCVYQPHSSFCRKILCARCWTDLSISFKILSDRVRLKLMHPDSLLFPIMHGLYKIFRLRHNFSPNLCSSLDLAVSKSGISKEYSVE